MEHFLQYREMLSVFTIYYPFLLFRTPNGTGGNRENNNNPKGVVILPDITRGSNIVITCCYCAVTHDVIT